MHVTRVSDLKKLYGYREKLAVLVVNNSVYAPIFLRVENEIAAAEALSAVCDADNLLDRARAISFHHREMV